MSAMWQKIKSWFLRTKPSLVEEFKALEAEVQETVTETKARVKRVKEEVADIVEATKDVVDQAGDVAAAAKGKPRKGRKKKK